MSSQGMKQLSNDASQPARVVQACTQCRDRKLKCVFEPSDTTDLRPCKRCRRESKECTLPTLKRRRYAVDSAELPAKRQSSSSGIGQRPKPTKSAPIPPRKPSDSQPAGAAIIGGAAGSQPQVRATKAYGGPEPVIRDAETAEDDDGYIISTVAPWALDFLPVTFCGTISDLSQAYEFRSPVELSDASSIPSGTDAEERSSVQDDNDEHRAEDTMAPPEWIFHDDNTTSISLKQLDKSQTETPSVFNRDLGLDDIFNFAKFA